MLRWYVSLALGFSFLHAHGAEAQIPPGTIDPSFSVRIEGNSPQVRSVVTQADGRLIIAGRFSIVNGLGRTNIARLNADATPDSSFLVNVDVAEVYGGVSAAELADGDLMIWGEFTAVNGVPGAKAARLSADGALRTGFAPAGTIDRFLAAYPDGRVLYTATGWPDLYRLNADGTPDPGFSVKVSVPQGGLIRTVVPWGSQLIMQGDFVRVQNLPRRYVARLNDDGSLDQTFAPVLEWPLGYATVQSDGKVVLGPNLVRLLVNGAVDPTFTAPLLGPFTSTSFRSLVQVGTKLVGIADYQRRDPYASYPAGIALVRMHPNGQVDTSFTNTLDITALYELPSSNSDRWLYRARQSYDLLSLERVEAGDLPPAPPKFVVQPESIRRKEGQLVVLEGKTLSPLPEVYQWRHGGTNLLGATNAFLAFTNAQMVIAGDYQLVASNEAGSAESDLATVTIEPLTENPGTVDPAFHPDWIRGPIDRMTLLPDQRIALQGQAIGPVDYGPQGPFVANPDGTQDTRFPPKETYALSGLDVAGQILGVAGGVWARPVSDPAGGAMVRLKPEGDIDPTFTPLLHYRVPAIASAAPDGRIFVAAALRNNFYVTYWSLVYLGPDGAFERSIFLGLGDVGALLPLPDGRVFIGWGTAVQAYGALGQPLTVPNDISPYAGVVRDLELQPDGKILVGRGGFDSPGPVLTRLLPDGTQDTQFNPNISFSDPGSWNRNRGVYSIAVQPDGKIVIGGRFTHVDGQSRVGIARLHADGTLDTSFDPGLGIASTEYGSPPPLFLGSAEVTHAALQEEGGIIIAGVFDKVDGVPRYNLARLRGGDLPSPPRIEISPADQTVELGGTVVLRGAVSGSPAPLVQWRHNGVAIPGATNRTLSLTNVDLASGGTYELQATNSLGSANSTLAKLSFIVPFRNPAVRDSLFRASFDRADGFTYAAEAKHSLSENWKSLPASSLDLEAGELAVPQVESQRFFRLLAK